VTRRAGCIAALLAAGLFASDARADVVLGAGLGVAQFSDDDEIDEGRGRTASVALEAGSGFSIRVVRLETDIWSLEMSGVAVAAGLRLAPGVDPGGSALFIDGGFYEAEMRQPGVAGHRRESGLYYAIGVDWMWQRGFGLRAEIAVADTLGDPRDVAIVTVGPVIRFGD
jgi:hypothetical protein